MRRDVGRNGYRGQLGEERQVKLATGSGVVLTGDFEEGRAGWNAAGGEPACYECRNTGHFRENCPN